MPVNHGFVYIVAAPVLSNPFNNEDFEWLFACFAAVSDVLLLLILYFLGSNYYLLNQ